MILKLLAICFLITLAACKTTDPASTVAEINPQEDPYRDGYRLKSFDYETDNKLLVELGARVGCRAASRWVLKPGSNLAAMVSRVYRSKVPYDGLNYELRNFAATQRACESSASENSKTNIDGFKKIFNRVRQSGNGNFGLTFVMVGGFGSHLTERGALFDSRKLWNDFKASLPPDEQKYLRVIRHECTPNSYARDEVCAPKMLSAFDTWEGEAEADNIEHFYLIWGYSKGGTTSLHALGSSEKLRNKTLALLTIGSPIGGGLPVTHVHKIFSEGIRRFDAMSPAEREVIRHALESYTRGHADSGQIGADDYLALVSPEQLPVTMEGFQSLFPSYRKRFLDEAFRRWSFDRDPSPISGERRVPVLHLAALTDIAEFKPIPRLTLNTAGNVAIDQQSMAPEHGKGLLAMPLFMDYPASDTCVALEHSVLPQTLLRGHNIKTTLLGVLNTDHMTLPFDIHPPDHPYPIPSLEMVDSILDVAEDHF